MYIILQNNQYVQYTIQISAKQFTTNLNLGTKIQYKYFGHEKT